MNYLLIFSVPGGVVYTRWGRKECPGNGTELIYTGNISLKNYQAVIVILFYLNKPVNTSIHPQCHLVVKRLIVVVDTVTNHNNSYHSSGTPQTPQYRHDKSISLWRSMPLTEDRHTTVVVLY